MVASLVSITFLLRVVFTFPDSNSSIEFDLSGLNHIQKDLEEIKSSLQGVTKITDLNEATKDLVKSTELETLVTVIVNKLLNNFESKLETKFETKLTQVTNNMQEKIDALSLENENLKGQLDATKNVLGNVKTTLNRNVILTKDDATIQSNYNEQYSRKNNIKVFNMKKSVE
jgi:deoxyribodipyrimidine photolyase